MEFIENVFRWLIWWIVSALLSLLDLVYGFCKELLSLDYLNLSDDIWMWFWLLTTAFTGFFVIFRIFKNFAIDAAEISDDKEMRINASRLITRLIALELVILLAQPILSGLSWVSSSLVENINTFTGTESTTLSAVILESGGVEVDEDGNWFVDITAKEDGEYVYFSSSFELAFIIIIVVLGTYQMFFIVFGIGERLVSMLVKLILAPWAFSSIVEPSPQNFATWCRLFLADFFGNFVVCFMLVAGCSVVMGMENLSGLIKCILLISVLVGTQTAPQTAAHLIGADIGMATGMKSLQTMMSIKGALTSGGRMIGWAAGAAATAGAMGIYTVGKKMGGISRHDDQLYSGHDVPKSGGSSGDAFSGVSDSGGSSDGATGGGYDGGGYNGATPLSTSTGTSGGTNVTRPNVDKNTRKAYDDSFAHRVANHNYKNKFTEFIGTNAIKLGGSLYDKSAHRLNQKEVNKYGGSSKLDAGRRATREERRV